jgi:hypothetical protein
MASVIKPARTSNAPVGERFFLAFSAYTATFILLYFEPVSIGPLNFASAWKIFAFLVIGILVVSYRSFQRVSSIVGLGALVFLSSLANPSLLLAPLETLSDSLKLLYIPAFFVALEGVRRKYGYTRDTLKRLTVHVAVFVVLSGVPFILGFLQPLSAGYDLSLFGLPGRGYTGVFLTSHGASIVTSTAAIVLVWAGMNARNYFVSAIYFALVALALYLVLQTFARTGYAIAAVGIIVVLLIPFRMRTMTIVMPVTVVATAFAYDYLRSDPAFSMRLQGQNVYTADSGGGELGSGRLRFWDASVDVFIESGPAGWVFGVGPVVARNEMSLMVSRAISAHNAFLNALMFYGLVGLTLYSVFVMKLIKYVWHIRRVKEVNSLAIALLAGYIVQLMVQGERTVLAELMLVLAICAGRVGLLERHVQRSTSTGLLASRQYVERI